MRSRFTPFILLLLFNYAYAQGPYRVISIPVLRNGSAVKMPWAGGMDAPQFSACDLNQDGIKDLFVFDRGGNRVMTFTGNGTGGDTAFTYAPQYEGLFPADLNNWALIRDYNKDGIPDIFTHTDLGTRVFKGSVQYGQLHFDLVSNLLIYPDTESNNQVYNINIFTYVDDIPAIVDVNGDGDLDILTYAIFAGTNVSYYENLTAENPGNPHYDIDSFQYSLVTQCWGDFVQDPSSNAMTLNAGCSGVGAPQHGSGGGTDRHTGNSLYPFQGVNDQAIDIINGNINYNNLAFMHNCGTRQLAHICSWDSLWPSCNTSVNLITYPAAFGLDVNNDGFEDVLVAPNFSNILNPSNLSSSNVNNVLYYRNTNDSTCQFALESDSFLVRLMLDYGSDSKPVFYDFNGDGLMDIVVGNRGYYSQYISPTSTLAYLQNTGTKTKPVFTEITADIDSISKYNFQGVHPAFGDLDGDGKPDLLIGEANGYLHFFKNMADSGSSYPTLTGPQYFNLKDSNYSAPFIYDVNGDSLNDLVVGSADGYVSYYWNFGTKTSPRFSQDSVNLTLGNVLVQDLDGSFYTNSQPFIRKDSAGNMLLYLGSIEGTVAEYLVDPAHLKDPNFVFTLLDSNIFKRSVGQNSAIAIADINDDGKLEYLVGNSLGGLLMFSDALLDSSTYISGVQNILRENEMEIYPNPSRDYFICAIKNGHFIHPVAEVLNIVGQAMDVDVQTSGDRITFTGSNLFNGFYLVRITDGNVTYTGKVLIER